MNRATWGRFFTRILQIRPDLLAAVAVKHHDLIEANMEEGAGDEQGFLGSSCVEPFGGKVNCSLPSFRFKKLQRPKLIWLAYQPANIEAVYHHKSMGPCPVEIRARCKGVLRWLVTISKCQNINFCVQSMLPARFTANFKESVLTIVFGTETEEA